jgi:lysylphosphatidylglycerol synthetase-like protein (DUF2156 family)
MSAVMQSPLPSSTYPPSAEIASAATVLARHAQNPSAFLALNQDTKRFTVPDVDGLVAYRPAGRRHLVQLGGVFADPAEQGRLLSAFLDFARSQRRRIVAVQLMRDDAELYAGHGFAVNQFGSDYARSLSSFSLAGKKHMQLRNKISRARRAGVTVVEVGVDAPWPVDVEEQLNVLDGVWLRSKGRHAKELAFMVGERGGPAAAMRRLFAAVDAADNVLGYVSFSPAYGRRAGWLHDLSRRRPDAPPGVLELIVATAVERFAGEGASHLHFGLTPFTGLADEHELPARSRVAAKVIRLLADHGSAIYPAADQLAYKDKWGLDLVQPEYVAFSGGVTVRAVWSLLRLTNAA